MSRLENLALAIAHMNSAFVPGSQAFKLKNPGLLRTWRPEKKVDSENYRIFTSIMGGLKALIADLVAKSNGLPHKLNPENPVRDLLAMFGVNTQPGLHKVILFLRSANEEDSLTSTTPISWFLESDAVTDTEEK